MMEKNFKLVITTFLMIVIIACSTVVFADSVIIQPQGTQNAEVTNNNEVQNTTQNEIQNEVQNVAQNVVQNTATYNSVNTSATYNTNKDDTLPKTGVTDGYVVAILVIVCAISAIYAYRKIRDYNIK